MKLNTLSMFDNTSLFYEKRASILTINSGGVNFALNMSKTRINQIIAVLEKDLKVGEVIYPKFGNEFSMSANNTGTTGFIYTLNYGRRENQKGGSLTLIQVTFALSSDERMALAKRLSNQIL